MGKEISTIDGGFILLSKYQRNTCQWHSSNIFYRNLIIRLRVTLDVLFAYTISYLYEIFPINFDWFLSFSKESFSKTSIKMKTNSSPFPPFEG